MLQQVNLGFHATEGTPLPPWVLELGASNPDIFFTDKSTTRSTDCLTWGIDDGAYTGHGCTEGVLLPAYSVCFAWVARVFLSMAAGGVFDEVVFLHD